MSKLHGAAKHAMWMAHAPLFSHDDGPVADPTGGTGVESDPNQGSIGVFANPNPADQGSVGVFADQANTVAATPVNPNPPATSGGGLAADFAKQTSTVAGLQNLLTQATATGTTIAKQVAPLTKKGKKNAAATAGKVDTTKDKSETPPPTKILGMSVPVFGVVAFLVVGGIVVGGLYAAAGVIGGGSSSATTVPLVPNLVSKAA
jgi:hypothetical protein